MVALLCYKQVLNENPALYDIRLFPLQDPKFFVFDNHPEVKWEWNDVSPKNPDVKVLVGRIGDHAVITKVFIPVSHGRPWAGEAVLSMRVNEAIGDCSICSKYTNLIAIRKMLTM